MAPAKVASRFAHLQAVMESGGQISVDGSERGFVTAFSAQQVLMAMRLDRGQALWPLLRRVDLALALVQATGKCIDETCAAAVLPAAQLHEVADFPARRFAQIQTLLAWGGGVSIGNCHPAAACAYQAGRLWVALTPRPAENVEGLLRRVDWSIAIAQSTRRCFDELFCSVTSQPINECLNHGSHTSQPHP